MGMMRAAGVRICSRGLHQKVLLTNRQHPQYPAKPASMGEYFDISRLPRSTRMSQYYDDIVSSDLLALTYSHLPSSPTRNNNRIRRWEGTSPYFENRPQLPPRGGKPLTPLAKARTHANIPRLSHIVVQSMVKEAITGNKNVLLSAAMVLQSITGQRPTFVLARKGVATFGLRKGMPVGVKAELRGSAMYNFLSSLTELILPRLKDFEGLQRSSGSGGAIDLGLTSAGVLLFPEIEATYDCYPFIPGMNISIVTTATTQAEAQLLATAFGLPYKDVDGKA